MELYAHLFKLWSEMTTSSQGVVRQLKEGFAGREKDFLDNKNFILDSIRSGYCTLDTIAWDLSEHTKNKQRRTPEESILAQHRARISKKCARQYVELYNQMFPRPK